MIKQMTNTEKVNIVSRPFSDLWGSLWGESANNPTYRNEYNSALYKFKTLTDGVSVNDNTYNLLSLIGESNLYSCWELPEWGFPKGRRNIRENDFNCAVREFSEETGYTSDTLYHIQNLTPVEEIFIGSNYKSYKHKYYVAFMDTNYELPQFEKAEVGNMEWMSFNNSVAAIRPYNLEKINIIKNVHDTICKYGLMSL
jgi:ADP-ribose pyrophosphatase YjhB (NUDIX family)